MVRSCKNPRGKNPCIRKCNNRNSMGGGVVCCDKMGCNWGHPFLFHSPQSIQRGPSLRLTTSRKEQDPMLHRRYFKIFQIDLQFVSYLKFRFKTNSSDQRYMCICTDQTKDSNLLWKQEISRHPTTTPHSRHTVTRVNPKDNRSRQTVNKLVVMLRQDLTFQDLTNPKSQLLSMCQ